MIDNYDAMIDDLFELIKNAKFSARKNDKGYGLYADQDIKWGEIIFVDRILNRLQIDCK